MVDGPLEGIIGINDKTAGDGLKKMRVAVIGMGSIGGTFAAHLDQERVKVSAVAREPKLSKLQKQGGISFQGKDKDGNLIDGSDKAMPVNFVASADELGVQDIVVIAMPADGKLDQTIADQLEPMLGAGTAVVFLQNGYPTYFRALTDNPNLPRSASDPEDRILNMIREEGAGIIGGVVDTSAEEHGIGDFRGDFVQTPNGLKLGKILLGAVDDDSVILEKLDFLEGAIDQSALPIRKADRQKLIDETCTKLLGNLSANLLSTITGMKLNDLLSDEEYYDLAKAMMDQAFEVMKRVGMSERLADRYDPAKALDYKKMLDHLASTAVDYENGKPTEIDVLTGAVIDIADALEAQGVSIDISSVRSVHECGKFLIEERDYLRDNVFENGTKVSAAQAAEYARYALDQKLGAKPNFDMAEPKVA